MEENQEYQNPWRYLESPFGGGDVGDFYGFVYNITNLQNQRQYIGRKYFWQKESLDLKIKLSSGEELHLKATGATTMDLAQSLRMILKNTGRNPLEELY